ncbi:flower [Carabus blaptoides fortunei]
MSFSEKIASIMARPGQDPAAKDDVAWWLKYAGRGLGTVGSFIAIFLGVWNCVSVLLGHIGCLVSGMWQMVAGFLVIVCEAPCCCLFVDFVQNLSEWVDKRPYWNRAVAYVVLAIPAIILCPSMSSIFGSGLIFTTGVLYGMMALGRKATAEEMVASATTDSVNSPPPNPLGPAKQTQRSTLVDNAQPMSFTGLPHFDSNV